MNAIYLYGREDQPEQTDRPPVFCAAHKSVSYALGSRRARTTQEPDSLGFNGYRFHFLNTGEVRPFQSSLATVKCYAVEAVPEDAARLREILDEIGRLHEQLRSVRRAAMKRGRRLTREDCRNWTP